MFEFHPFTFLFPPVSMAAEQGPRVAAPSLATQGRAERAPDHAERPSAPPPGGWWARLHSSSPSGQELGLALVRVGFGASLAFGHGLPKLTNASGFVGRLAEGGFPAASFFGWAAILSEFVGGILLAVGLLTRPAAAFVFATLAVAAFHFHASDPFGKKELALAYALVSLAAFVAGPGRYSLDALWARRAAIKGSAPQSSPEAEPRAS